MAWSSSVTSDDLAELRRTASQGNLVETSRERASRRDDLLLPPAMRAPGRVVLFTETFLTARRRDRQHVVLGPSRARGGWL